MSKEIRNLILTVTGIILTWMLVVPIFEFPDEQSHFETITFVKDKGRVSVGNEKDMTREMYETQLMLGVLRNDLGQNKYTYHPEYRLEYTDSLTGKYESSIKALNNQEARTTYIAEEAASYPILYYQFMGVFTQAVNSHDLILRLFVTRLGGLTIAAGLAYVTWLIGREVFKGKKLAITLMVITMLQPMMSFVTAGVNSDNLHNLWFMLILFFCLRLIKTGLKFKYLSALAILTILDISTKPQGFIAVPVIAVASLMAVIFHKAWKSFFWLVIIGVVAVIAVPGQWALYRSLFNVSNANGASFVEYLRFSANKLIAQNVVWYWGVFKWLGVVLPAIYWRVANRVVLLSALGLAVFGLKVVKKKKVITDPRSLTFLILSSVVYALVIFWYDWQHLKIEGFSLGIQARYFFPTLVAHLAILLTGITALGWNAGSRKVLRIGIVLLFVWLQLGGIWRILSIYYDTSNFGTLIAQISQYKPFFAKGNWWYLWGSLYLFSLLYLLKTSLNVHSRHKK